MTYKKLLSTTDWKYKRYNIIKRDDLRCRNCNNTTYFKEGNAGIIKEVRNIDQRIDVLNGKLLLLNGYKILFNEDIHNHMIHDYSYSEEKLKIDHEKSVYTYDSFIPHELDGCYVIYKVKEGLIREFCIAKDWKNSYKWLYVSNLHVHHKYYQDGKKPWQYPETALVTLCWVCHEELHSANTVPWLNDKGDIKGHLTNCSRCYGAGYIPKYSYFENGICFTCNGKQYKEFI